MWLMSRRSHTPLVLSEMATVSVQDFKVTTAANLAAVPPREVGV
jgi:hypothetical protein